MDNSNKVSRRDFLKITGAAGAATILTAGCASDKGGNCGHHTDRRMRL